MRLLCAAVANVVLANVIGNVVIIVASVASWLFWLCAWLHQWHPLIKPIYEIEE